MDKQIWINNKNKREYCVETTAINKTTEQDGQEMWVYWCRDTKATNQERGTTYVRSKEEFKDKFTKITK